MSEGTIRVFSWRALPWVLFALSLALNVFFIGGHVYTRSVAHDGVGKPPATQTRLTTERLGLNVAQQGSFRDFRDTVKKRGRVHRKRAARHARRIWAELESPNPNMRTVNRNLRKLYDQRYAFQRRAAKGAVDFMATLSSDQKREFLDMARARNFMGARLLKGKAGPAASGDQ